MRQFLLESCLTLVYVSRKERRYGDHVLHIVTTHVLRPKSLAIDMSSP
jgi:hypothetical protein